MGFHYPNSWSQTHRCCSQKEAVVAEVEENKLVVAVVVMQLAEAVMALASQRQRDLREGGRCVATDVLGHHMDQLAPMKKLVSNQ